MDLMISPEIINLYNSILMLSVIMVGIFLFYRLLSRYFESNQRFSSSPSITISNVGKSDDEVDRSGYAFIEVPDDKKSIFADAMQGFKDFAKLKGYNVECSIDTSFSGKVGVRFVILDHGVTVSTAKVRDDVRDYLDRIKNADDLSDMPMPADPVEHQHIISALQSRFSYLRHQAELLSIKSDFYKGLLAEWAQLSRSPIAYAPNLQLTFQNEGGTTMRDKFSAENSANIAQGRNASAYNEGSIRIGSTHSERNTQIASLKALEDAISKADLAADVKSKANRHLQNAREELEESDSPKPESVESWLKKAKNTLAGVSAGGELLEKLNDMLNIFGMNSPTASFQNI